MAIGVAICFFSLSPSLAFTKFMWLITPGKLFFPAGSNEVPCFLFSYALTSSVHPCPSSPFPFDTKCIQTFSVRQLPFNILCLSVLFLVPKLFHGTKILQMQNRLFADFEVTGIKESASEGPAQAECSAFQAPGCLFLAPRLPAVWWDWNPTCCDFRWTHHMFCFELLFPFFHESSLPSDSVFSSPPFCRKLFQQFLLICFSSNCKPWKFFLSLFFF